MPQPDSELRTRACHSSRGCTRAEPSPSRREWPSCLHARERAKTDVCTSAPCVSAAALTRGPWEGGRGEPLSRRVGAGAQPSLVPGHSCAGRWRPPNTRHTPPLRQGRPSMPSYRYRERKRRPIQYKAFLLCLFQKIVRGGAASTTSSSLCPLPNLRHRVRSRPCALAPCGRLI